MALNTLPNEGLTNRGYPSDRIVTPIIINGDMSVAQRGTSSTGQTGSGYKTVDRIRLSPGGGMTFTVEQASESPTGQGFTKSYKVTSTTGDATMTAAEYNIPLQMRMEGNTLQSIKKGTSNAEKITFAFWVYATVTGTYVLELTDDDNNRYVSQTYTISSSNTWEKKIVNFPADTTGAFGNDNNKSMTINFWGGAGTNFTSGSLQTTWGAEDNTTRATGQVNAFASNNNVWQITGLQLEVGEFDSTSIPSFSFESFENNLRRCQRYFETFPSNGGDGVIGFGYGSGSDTARTMFTFKVTKRATPTMSDSLSSSRQYRINFMNGSGTATNQNSTSTPGFGTVSTLNSGYMNLAGFSSIGGGLFGFLIYNNSTTLLSADAEL